MLFTMLCCSYPFERRDDDDQDPRTQTKIMQRILKGRSSSADFIQDWQSFRGLKDASETTPRPQCMILQMGPGNPMKAVPGIPERSHRISLPSPHSSAQCLRCICAQIVNLTLQADTVGLRQKSCTAW